MTPRKKTSSDPSATVDSQLARYRAMRDFAVTGEPRGGGTGRSPKATESLPFVVQKHAARQLHYDLRLGWRGVLKSWAVAKGPSYISGDKRLAVEVEDHPMEYGGFEGTIPKGQYGGGTVMVWDFGDWQPLGDVDHDLEKGDLKFILNGAKLKGKWVLVRMRKNPDRDRSDKPNWLLIKERDEYVQPENSASVTDLAPNSALTQRTMEQIAASSDHIWDSGQGLRELKADHEALSKAQTKRTATKKSATLERLPRSAPKENFPCFIAPQLAEEARSAPGGRNWVHELKLDGYRIQVHVQGGAQGAGEGAKVRLFTRKGLDWATRMPTLAQAAARLGVASAIVDGEVVVLDESGRSNFPELQAAFQNGKHGDMVYFAFDLLHLNGRNLRVLPLLQRKEILEELLSQADSSGVLRFCEHIKARGDIVFAKASELGAEGIVSKLVTAPYTSGRGNTWLKMKSTIKQEFVIGGFTPVSKTGHGIGSLLVGYYDGGKLLYAGRCGTGFSHAIERMLRVRLDALAQKAPSFAELPREARKGAVWVKPELVAQIVFAGWTKDDLIRQSSFKSLREDKPATEVVRETALMGGASCQADPGARYEVRKADAKVGPKGIITLGITRPGKVLDEESGMTKQDLAEYYLAVAKQILPHIAGRPLSVLRCPDGIGGQAFFQKHASAGMPNGVHSVSIANKKTGKREEFLTLNSAEGLVGMAQLGVLEIHPWGSKNVAVDQPDRIIFDLDPDETISWNTLADAADELRSRLKQLNLASFVKSTGGKGLHVVVPIEPEYEWPVIKDFSHRVVLQMERENSKLYTANMLKAVRKNRIYLDYLRNNREATAIAPFSTRARPGVPVAVTLDWKELKAVAKPEFHVSDLSNWQQRLRRDPWSGLLKSRQRLTRETLVPMGVKLTDG
jgi:bifunctional non-homologous end joining protein LigD